MQNLNEKDITQYKGYGVYSGKKSDQGLIHPMIDWLIDVCDYVEEVHLRPIAFHITLYYPNYEKLKTINKLLKRLAKEYVRDDKHSTEIFYMIAHEIRPRTKQEHSHLWVFTDNMTPLARRTLLYKLVKHGYAESVKLNVRDRKLFPEIWHGNLLYHSIRCEKHDLLLRATYITKYATKITGMRRWSRSVLPCITKEPVQQTEILTFDDFEVPNFCYSQKNNYGSTMAVTMH
jgi:hypothetical protein